MCRPSAGEELLDLVEDLVRLDERHVVVALQLDEARDPFRDVAALADVRVEVAGPVEDQGRHWTLGSTARTSTIEFIRIRSRAPAGLRLARPRRPSQLVIVGSAVGATVDRSKSTPQLASSASASRRRASRVGAHG